MGDVQSELLVQVAVMENELKHIRSSLEKQSSDMDAIRLALDEIKKAQVENAATRRALKWAAGFIGMVAAAAFTVILTLAKALFPALATFLR